VAVSAPWKRVHYKDALALDSAGVQIVSVREPWLDTGGPVRNLLLAICSWVDVAGGTALPSRGGGEIVVSEAFGGATA
jgi:hypothetical protein